MTRDEFEKMRQTNIHKLEDIVKRCQIEVDINRQVYEAAPSDHTYCNFEWSEWDLGAAEASLEHWQSLTYEDWLLSQAKSKSEVRRLQVQFETTLNAEEAPQVTTLETANEP